MELLKGNDELRGILNVGYTRRTAYVVRVGQGAAAGEQPGKDAPGEPGTTSRLARFSCWCPKVMAAIGRLPDTLSDRCIVIRMQRRTRQESCERLRHLDGTTIRRQCLRFVQDHREEIQAATPAIPEQLNDRAGDVWEPLLALADIAGAHWPAQAREAALQLAEAAQEQNPIGSLLLDIFCALIVTKQDRILSRALVEGLAGSAERPWGELLRGRPVSELWIAQQLRPYGIRPRLFRLEGQRARGYFKEDMVDAFQRYVPKSEVQRLLEEARE
jgi:hypothetical protein